MAAPKGMKINPEYKAWQKRYRVASANALKARKATTHYLHKSMYGVDADYERKREIEREAEAEFNRVMAEKPEVFVSKK